MTTTANQQAVANADPQAADLERYGITRVRADTYHVGGYRYGKIADAIAQAKRVEHSEESPT